MMNLILKELREGLRSYKFLIIAFALLFFALLDPITLKLLPKLLKSQIGMEGFAEMMNINQSEAIKSYLGDVLQIVPVVIAFTIGGIVTKEFTEHYIDIPLSKGMDLNRLYTAKWIVYIVFIIVTTFIAMAINYTYASLIFGYGMVSLRVIFRAYSMIILILIYYISTHLLMETWVRKSYLASILSIAVFFGQYGMLYLVGLKWRHIFPHYLMIQSTTMTMTFRSEDLTCMTLTILYSLILLLVGRLAIDHKRIY
jgi:ABC-2 type transport system permease protein